MVRLRCFGRVRIENGRSEPVSLRSRKHLALLVYLVGNPRRRHSRDRLVDLFWDSEPRLARHSLSQALYDIRSRLPGAKLDSTVRYVALDPAGIEFDAAEFEGAIEREDLESAVDLYEGDFAPELEQVGRAAFERWLEGERERLRHLAELALNRFVQECDRRGEWGRLCVTALRLIEMNPFHEEAHRSLMRGLWLGGDQAGALRHYDRFVAPLETEISGGLSEETHRLRERIGSSRPARPDPTVRIVRAPRMIGRGAEFEDLKGALARTQEGRSGLVVVRGEAGLGKTRLVEEFVASLGLESLSVLRSSCYAAESSIPFGPVKEGLEPAISLLEEDATEIGFFHIGDLFPDAFPSARSGDGTGIGDPAAARRRLFEEIAELIRRLASTRPVVWVVEDVHWIDDSSASLFHYMVRRLQDTTILFVMTVRTHETSSNRAADRLLKSESVAECRQIELAPLDSEQTVQLAEEAAPDRDLSVPARTRLHELSGGNPFFVLELLQASGDGSLLLTTAPYGGDGSSPGRMIDALSPKLSTVMEHRLHGLEPDALRVLEAVSVAGRDARATVVGAASGLSSERVVAVAGDLYARGLLRDRSDGLEFQHDIIRGFVYENLGGLQRSALHLSTAEVLSSRPGAGPGPLARHFRLGGDSARAHVFAIRAASRAEASHGHEEARRFGELALSTSGSTADRTAALAILSRAELATGHLEGAQLHMEEMISLGCLPTEEAGAVQLRLATAMVELSRWEPAMREVGKLETLIAKLDDPLRTGMRLRALSLRLKVAYYCQEERAAARAAEEIRTICETRRDDLEPDDLAIGLYSLAGYMTFTESSEAALDMLPQEGSGNPALSWVVRTKLSLIRSAIYLRLGRWDQAQHVLSDAYHQAKHRRDILVKIQLLNNISVLCLERGRWKEVDEHCFRIEQLSSSLSKDLQCRAVYTLNLADAAWYRGDAETARRELSTLLANLDDTGVVTLQGQIHASLGLLALQSGRLAAAHNHRHLADSYNPLSSIGTFDKFKPAWLNFYIDLLNKGVVKRDAYYVTVDSLRATDRVSAVKMQCIGHLVFRLDTDRHYKQIKDELSSLELTWFPYFVRRWLQRVKSRT